MSWCSSAENPEKILLFINNSLIHLATPALELLGKKKADDKKGNKWWLSLYAHSVAVIGIYFYRWIYICIFKCMCKYKYICIILIVLIKMNV
jgi:hypothetical protein